jgi:hypothetical protein
MLTQLKDKGYNVIRLPREGIRPLDVIAGNSSQLEYLGALHTVWTSTAKEPEPYQPRSTAGIEGGSSRAIKASLGLSILGDLLAGFGVSSPKLETAFNRARTLAFKYDAPKQWGIEPFNIGDYLRDGDLVQGNRVLDKHIRDSRFYLVTELLLSNSLTVIAEAKTSADAAVDAGVLEDAIEAKMEVAVEQGQHASITFRGKNDVAFGFKAFELTFSDGDWTIGEFADPGSVSFDTNQPAETPPATFGARLVDLGQASA